MSRPRATTTILLLLLPFSCHARPRDKADSPGMPEEAGGRPRGQGDQEEAMARTLRSWFMKASVLQMMRHDAVMEAVTELDKRVNNRHLREAADAKVQDYTQRAIHNLGLRILGMKLE